MTEKCLQCDKIQKKYISALNEQQNISRMLIQKDLLLAFVNEKLNKQVSQLKALHAITNRIRIINDKQEMLGAIAKGLVIDIEYSCCAILFGSNQFVVSVEYGYKPIDKKSLVANAFLAEIFKRKKPYLIRNSAKGNEKEKELGRVLNLRSFYILPINVRNKQEGLFICGIDHPYQTLTEVDEDFLEIAAHSISINIETLEIEAHRREIEALKTEFVSIASHQLRTPLSIMKWILDMLNQGDLGALSAEQKDFIKKAYLNNESMISLVNDLLNVSNADGERLRYNFNKVDLAELLRKRLERYQLISQKKQINFIHNFHVDGEMLIKADPMKILIVFDNIVENAVKFTPQNGRINMRISRNKIGSIEVSVADTGIGISKEDSEKMFTKFFRAQNAKLIQTEGNGLGLYIAQDIMKKHHGLISFESELGKGTTFTCVFPAYEKN